MLRIDAPGVVAAPAGPDLPAIVDDARRDFDAVYDAHFDEVARWIRALGGLAIDVDDLAQEVFVVVQRQLPRFDGRHLRAWLYRIAARTVSDWRRRAWFRGLLQRREVVLEEIPATAPGPVEALERREAQRVLAALLARMSPKRRTAFILAELEGYTSEEIAALQGVPAATVRTRLHHARRDFVRLCAEQQRREAR
jgi:RNA polymerase sigma-70 factor (ECF subfamily)